MTVVVKADELEQLLDPDAEVERLATGFIFTEGPIWNAEGEFLLFSDMPGDVRRRWSERDGVEEVMRPANKCNGMVYDADGNLLVCEHVTSSLVREQPDGTRETIASHFRGKELQSPNDVVTRSDGTIYFSDPWFGRVPVFGVEREHELDFQGVYRIAAGGGEPELAVAEDEFELPNGLCFSPDESLLYINDTHHALIRVYDVGRRRDALQRAPVLRRDRQRRDRGGHPGRDEVRRARQHLGHRPRRRLDHQRARRAPGRARGPRERRQPRVGRLGLAHAVHPELDVACTASRRRWRPPAFRTTTEEERHAWPRPIRSASTRGAPR